MPLEPDVIIIHESLLEAFHEQFAGKVTLTLPFPPDAGNDWLVGEIIGAGLLAVTEIIEELLLLFESGVSELMVAVLEILVPFATPQLTIVTSVMVADVPDPIAGNVIVRLLPDPPHTPPPVELQDTNEVVAGRLSVTVTVFAVSGPLLVIVRV